MCEEIYDQFFGKWILVSWCSEVYMEETNGGGGGVSLSNWTLHRGKRNRLDWKKLLILLWTLCNQSNPTSSGFKFMKNVGDLPEYPGLKANGTLCYIKCLFIIVTRCTMYISISSLYIDIDFLNLGNFISLRGGKFLFLNLNSWDIPGAIRVLRAVKLIRSKPTSMQ